LPDAEVQAFLADLTIASGNGSVYNWWRSTEAVIVTGSRNIVGNNNQVIVNQGTDPDELVNMLRRVFQHNEKLPLLFALYLIR
jgi:protein associated with RNAse G/E